MQISIELPHAFGPESHPTTNAQVLKAVLDCMVALNLDYLRSNPGFPSIYQSGIRYGRCLIWDTVPALIIRGYGDCKSLAPWLIAEYATKGIPSVPVFRWLPSKEGVKYHILVHTERGYEDPSKALGMGTNEYQG